MADIEVDGLRDFQRELRALDKSWGPELRKTNKSVAEKVAEGVRSSFSSRSGVAPKVAASVRAVAEQRSAGVKIGGARYPYAMGANFGSHAFKQFPPPVDPDYSLFRTIRAERDSTLDAYEKAVADLTKRAFPN